MTRILARTVSLTVQATETRGDIVQQFVGDVGQLHVAHDSSSRRSAHLMNRCANAFIFSSITLQCACRAILGIGPDDPS